MNYSQTLHVNKLICLLNRDLIVLYRKLQLKKWVNLKLGHFESVQIGKTFLKCKLLAVFNFVTTLNCFRTFKLARLFWLIHSGIISTIAG